jgi:PKD repeat protein
MSVHQRAISHLAQHTPDAVIASWVRVFLCSPGSPNPGAFRTSPLPLIRRGGSATRPPRAKTIRIYPTHFTFNTFLHWVAQPIQAVASRISAARIDTTNFRRVTFLMSQPKATANSFPQSHIRMDSSKSLLDKFFGQRDKRNKLASAFPIMLAILLAVIATSCGAGGAGTGGNVPIANPGGPYLGNVNQALSFNGSHSTAPSGQSLTSFGWIFGDGGTGTGANVSHTYTVAGNFTATLTVTDSSGTTASSSVAVQIITAPVAKPGGPYTGKVGTAVSFNGSASTAPPGQLLGFSWSFGDGSTGSGATPPHTYGSACVCTVSLTVTDDTAGTSFATTTATITTGPSPSGGSTAPQTFFAIGPAANASSQFAYMLTTSSSGASSLAIATIDNATGNLQSTDVTSPQLDSTFVPAGMIADPTRKFLYLYGGNSVLTFSIASDTGALIPSGTTSTSGGIITTNNEKLVFSLAGKFAFFIAQDANAADATSASSITRFSVDPTTGALGAIETVSAQVSRAQSAAIDPAGKFLYVSGFSPTASTDISSAAPQIAIFAVAEGTAALTPISQSPLTIESGVSAPAIAIDSTGRFIYAAGANSSTNSAELSVFSINSATGALSQSAATTPLVDPLTGGYAEAATSLALSKSDQFAYVLTDVPLNDFPARQAIQVFELNPQTGAPKFVSSAATNSSAVAPAESLPATLVLFSPAQLNTIANSSGFLFVTNPSDATVLLFSTDAKTGLLNFRAATSSQGH